MKKYFKKYKWSNIFAMLRNQKLDPEICEADFKNRLAVITGATSGIGLATAKKYASHGANILCINRNETKSKDVCAMLKKNYGAICEYLIADFAKLSEIHSVGKQLAELNRKIDVLIHNAGVFITRRSLTEDNLEKVFQTNYLASFIINQHIKEKLKGQNSGRIIYVNSEAHRFAVWGLRLDDLAWEKRHYTGLKSYGAAKMAQLLSILKWRDYFSGGAITVNAMHPGNVKTSSGQNNGPIYKWFKRVFVDRSARSLETSAEALYFLGVSEKVEGISGKFFNLTTQEEPAPPALDREAAEELWVLSLELGGQQ